MYYRFFCLLESLSPVLGVDSAGEVAANAGDMAETAGQVTDFGNQAGFMGSIWVWVIYAVVIGGAFFLMSRPQRKREKEMKELQSSIKPGDNVVTSGGLYGRVADIGEDCFIIEFGTNRGVRIPVQKSDVLGIRAPKTTPAPKDASDKSGE